MGTPKKRCTITVTFELEPASEKKDMSHIMHELAADVFEYVRSRTRGVHYYRPIAYSGGGVQTAGAIPHRKIR